MQVYEIKRKIKQKNEWIYNILKKIGSVWNHIRRIPIKFREYKKIKKQITLFLILYSMIAILTIFTSNDIIILTFTPFICCFCKKAKINPLPYLFGEFFAANTWSMFLIIGNPTNIYLASSAGIDFFTYIGVMFLPTFGGGIVSLLIIIIIFYKELKKPIEKVEYENITLDKAQIIIGLIHLFIIIYITYKKPNIAKSTPVAVAILSGFTENAVNPLIQSPNSFPNVYPECPYCLCLCVTETVPMFLVVRKIKPIT